MKWLVSENGFTLDLNFLFELINTSSKFFISNSFLFCYFSKYVTFLNLFITHLLSSLLLYVKILFSLDVIQFSFFPFNYAIA